MPQPRTPAARRRGLSRNALAVYGTTAALFVTTFGFLGLRVASGQDPALSARTSVHTTQVAQVAATAALAQQTQAPTAAAVQTATS